MDLNKMLGANMTAMELLPPEVKPIIERLLEGRFRSLVIIGEEEDSGFGDMFTLDMDGGVSNVYALIGALESVKRDLLELIPSRREGEGGDEEDENDE